eukprot:11183788-Lingulodinium_polyedra.AAC.1
MQQNWLRGRRPLRGQKNTPLNADATCWHCCSAASAKHCRPCTAVEKPFAASTLFDKTPMARSPAHTELKIVALQTKT